jgi:hypothetical protein
MDTIANLFRTLENELDDDGDVTEIQKNFCYIKVHTNNQRVKNIIHECCQNMEIQYNLEFLAQDLIKLLVSYNACTICKVNMGLHNPRQYCKKYYCPLMLVK